MCKRITVIGDGGMGTACAVMLAENHNAVTLWSAFPDQAAELIAHRENRRFLPGCELPESLTITSDGAEALADVSLVISAVPTQYMRSVWQGLEPHCPAGVSICSVAKGIENGTLLRPTEILADVLGDKLYGVAALSGPSIAPEIAQRLPASVTVASTSGELATSVQTAISHPYFRVYTNTDLVGVELAGATKNVIAIAAGMIDGMQFGDNAKAALVTRGLAEITRLGIAAGARAETFAGLAGIGDLVTTCISPVGRNRSFGQAIGKGKSAEEILAGMQAVVEGVATTRSMVELAKKLGVILPITQAIYDVLFEKMDPKAALVELMTRPLRAEDQNGTQTY